MTALRNKFLNRLPSIMTSVISLATSIPDRLMGIAWRVLMAIAPIHTNISIDIRSLFTWNVIPYRSPKVPLARWADFLVASHEYQGAVRDELWAEVQNNVSAVRSLSIQYIQDEAGLGSLYRYGCLLLKTSKSLILLVKAQESYKVSHQAVEDLNEEIRTEELRRKIAEIPNPHM